MCHHLRDLELVNTFHETVDILIGQDEFFLPLAVYSGAKDEHYAVKTPLGYVIHCPNSTHIVGRSVVSNCVSTTSYQDDVNRFWELDQCDLSTDTGLSVDDRYVVSFREKYSSFAAGHWQVPIPWKQNDLMLPNNCNQAKARLIC